MSLVKYTNRRILALIPILFGVLFIPFIMTHIMPGTPVTARGGAPRAAAKLGALAA